MSHPLSGFEVCGKYGKRSGERMHAMIEIIVGWWQSMEYVWVVAISLDPWSNCDAMKKCRNLGHQLTAFWRHLCVDAFRRQSTAPSERQRAKVMHRHIYSYVRVFFEDGHCHLHSSLTFRHLRCTCSGDFCRGCGVSPTPAARIPMQSQRP